jgi:hypothetical protein
MTKNNVRAEPHRFYSRPTDRSFPAFKAFVDYMTTSLDLAPDVSEDELREAWREFWEGVGSAERTPP